MTATEPAATVLVMSGRIHRTDIDALCESVRALLSVTEAALMICDVAALEHPDAVAVDALTRLQLVVKRMGREIRIRHARDELRSLLDLMGLSDVVPLSAR